jgi:hypothetical protein
MEWGIFWAAQLALFIFIPLMVIWLFAIVDLFGRADIGGFGKALWLLAILFLPILGTLMYYAFRPVARSYVWEPRSTSGSNGGQPSSS